MNISKLQINLNLGNHLKDLLSNIHQNDKDNNLLEVQNLHQFKKARCKLQKLNKKKNLNLNCQEISIMNQQIEKLSK
jgi:hypothetical protein